MVLARYPNIDTKTGLWQWLSVGKIIDKQKTFTFDTNRYKNKTLLLHQLYVSIICFIALFQTEFFLGKTLLHCGFMDTGAMTGLIIMCKLWKSAQIMLPLLYLKPLPHYMVTYDLMANHVFL